MADLPAVDDVSFASAVERGGGLTMVDFGAEWCAPCRLIAPVLESLAAEYGEQVRVFALDVDANPATAARYSIRNLPTVLFFRDGELVDRVVGAVPRRVFEAKLDELLAS